VTRQRGLFSMRRLITPGRVLGIYTSYSWHVVAGTGMGGVSYHLCLCCIVEDRTALHNIIRRIFNTSHTARVYMLGMSRWKVTWAFSLSLNY